MRYLALVVGLALILFAAALPRGRGGAAVAQQRDGEPIVLYSGRSKTLVEPLLRVFTEQTGIAVSARYAKTAPLALALVEEGGRSPADLFWSQDVGTLGMLAGRGLFAPLPEEVTGAVAVDYVNADRLWVGTSGRLRVLAYAPSRVEESQIPASVFDLADPRFRDRVGWAPTNASFQAFVTAMRKTHGDETAGRWLTDMKANGARAFPKNTAIVQGIAAGEIDFGLPNHYYLLRFKTADKSYPVEQTAFAPGDIGNMNNLAGVGLLATSRHKAAAMELVKFLLSAQAQQYFVGKTFELPVTPGIITGSELIDPEAALLNKPALDLDELGDLEGTLELMREVGLL